MTEVGMIPWDWEVKEFKNVATLINGRAYSQFELLDRGKYRVLRVGNFGTNDSWYYSNLELPDKMYCEKGDLLYCWSCTYGAYIWNQEKTIYHYHIWKVANLKAEKKYLQYILNNDVAQQMNSSNGSTMAHITKGFLENRLFAFPTSIEEQQRIANALSDVDSLINNLEKLIAKKKNIKQGAMQQLLTGRKRLPGFGPSCHPERSTKCAAEESSHFKMTELGPIPSDWEVKKLSGVCSVVMGQSPDSKFYNEKYGIPLIQGNADIEKRETFVRFYTTQVTKKGLKGDLILTVRAPVGSVAKATFDCCLGRGVCALRNASEFLYQYLIYIEKEWSKQSAGSTFDSIKSEDLCATLVVVPSSKAEQTAIANVLSDMDSEIQTLETKLAKYRKLKTGMMQQLLTGKIRLIQYGF